MKRWNRPILPTAALLAASLLGPAARGEDQLDDLDITGGGSVDVITWEPYLSAFYVVPRAGGGDGEEGMGEMEFRAVESKPGLSEAWRTLEPLVAPRGREDYRPDEPVCSGWRLVNEGEQAGLAFESHMAGVEGREPQSWFDVQPFHVIVGLDVLMSTDQQTREDLLRERFSLVEESLTAYEVSKDPERYREHIPVWGSTGTSFFSVGNDLSRNGDPLRVRGPGEPILPHGEFHLRTVGAYELRYRARVRCLLVGSDAFDEVKTVEAALRVKVVRSGTEINQLGFQPTPRMPAPAAPTPPVSDKR